MDQNRYPVQDHSPEKNQYQNQRPDQNPYPFWYQSPEQNQFGLCEEWWDACKEEYTCHRNWITDMDWGEINSCKEGSVCKKYKEFYSSAADFCTAIWHDAYKVVPDSEPCMVFTFDPSKPNPNTAVAQAAAEEKAAA
ncbi:sperm-egg fusion protein Juno-like [Lingula anatina]|uniref:Sperm-egg fusion protein Juno-like n=1 Tax=Lingula anatina TaxID=7574 RepID=A0A1S3JE41_LINAN|nr:sperm-egg fusion protein Juno-like [Lingula anatina]|eukprot:XP_013408672.1 sperm-egg fusion protein Juno-like [Lingula anatina]